MPTQPLNCNCPLMALICREVSGEHFTWQAGPTEIILGPNNWDTLTEVSASQQLKFSPT